MSEMKPCPFCGSKALTNIFLDYEDIENLPTNVIDDYEPEVTCENERCIYGWWLSPKDWNTRPIEDALNARIAELEEEQVILKDQMREAKNILIDKRLHIDSLYEEGYKLQQRIAELEAAQRWVPVSERLPEECTPVLTLSKDNDKPVTAFLDAGLWWSNVDWALNVTHWMPLPQPPEVQE